MTKVLVTDGGRGMSRSAVATTRALGMAGHVVLTTESGTGELAARSRYSSSVLAVPPAADRAAFAAAVAPLVERHGIDYVFATSDDAVLALHPELARVLDKEQLTHELTRLGIATPPAFAVDQNTTLPPDTSWPAVIKPLTGSEPARTLRSAAELEAHVRDGNGSYLVQPFLSGPMKAIAGVIWDGELVAAVHQDYERTWPVACGTASSAITVGPDLDAERDLVALLGDHRGVFQAQYIDGQLIDVNPRPYGSLPLAVASGANLPDIAVRCHLGHGPTSTVRGRPGTRYRWLEGDLRHVAAEVRSGSLGPVAALRALAPRRGAANSLWSRQDLGPAMGRLRHIVASAMPGGDT